MIKRAKDATLAEIMAARSGRRTPCAASSAFSAKSAERRSNHPRTDDERMYKIAK